MKLPALAINRPPPPANSTPRLSLEPAVPPGMVQRGNGGHFRPQDRQHRTVGASDAAALLGLSQWKTVYDALRELTNAEYRTSYIPRQVFGHIVEPGMLRYVSMVTGCPVCPGPSISERPWLAPPDPEAGGRVWAHARPDGYGVSPSGLFLVEVKSTSTDNFNKDWAGGVVPGYYVPQLAWQVAVADLIGFHVNTVIAACVERGEGGRTTVIVLDADRLRQLGHEYMARVRELLAREMWHEG